MYLPTEPDDINRFITTEEILVPDKLELLPTATDENLKQLNDKLNENG